MRSAVVLGFASLASILAIVACSGDDNNGIVDTGDSGTTDAGGDDVANPGDSGNTFDVNVTDAGTDVGDAAPTPRDTTPTILAAGNWSVAAVLPDGTLLLQNNGSTPSLAYLAANAAAGAMPQTIVNKSVNVYPKGGAVFAYDTINYTTNIANLTIWSPSGGTHDMGQSNFSDSLIDATKDGQWVMYTTNLTPTTFDIVMSKSDFSETYTVVSGAGRGSNVTCGPSFSFVGAHAFVAWCGVGTQDATLARFDVPAMADGGAGGGADAGLDAGPLTPAVIATNANNSYSADATGDHVFFTTTDSKGHVWNAQGSMTVDVDTGVTGGTILPDATALLYTTQDELRRTPLPAIAATPIVVHYSNKVGFSPDYSHVLYSTTVTYNGAEKRDLILAQTTSLNSSTDTLVNQPTANVSSSYFTADGKYVLWLSDVGVNDNGTATLNIRSVSGGTARTFPGVNTVLATTGSYVLFTDNESGKDVYPVTTDLEWLDCSSQAAPMKLQQHMVTGNSFVLTPQEDAVYYARTSQGWDAGVDAGGLDGVWKQPLPF